MMELNLFIKEQDVGDIPSILRNGIVLFNKTFFGERLATDFAICIEDENKNLIGGISGYYAGNCVIVQWACVNQVHRKRGVGTMLFKKLDEFALSKNCKFINLETMAFQARNFYERFGFAVVTTLEDWFDGYALHIMRKKL